MRRLFILGLVGAFAALLPASTLLQLSLNNMILQSTMIVHGKVQPTSAMYRGSMIFTHYTVQVTEIYKAPASSQGLSQIDIGVPGGIIAGAKQSFAGVPALSTTQDYVLFLWTSKTGLTQVIGLSQGLFSVISTPGSAPMVVRAATQDRMVNSAGQPVADSGFQMPLSQLKSRIQTVLSGQGVQ